MEIFDIAMVKRLSGGVPLVGVEDQKMLKEIKSELGGSGEHGGEGLLLGDTGAGDDVSC